MQLDHATIVTADLDAARRFFVEIAGLTDGTRPPFGVDGHWLYSDGRPVIHLVDSTLPGNTGRAAPRIDHIAFRLDGDEWRALLARLAKARVPYQTADVPLSEEVQLFVALGAAVVVEFVTAAANHAAPVFPVASPLENA
jgi:catechol 2,3-dioxygenase-like lactoylglutathione lyase family enzyme